MTTYDDLISYRFAAGKGYDKQSVETFRAMALNQVDELLHQLTTLQDQVAGGKPNAPVANADAHGSVPAEPAGHAPPIQVLGAPTPDAGDGHSAASWLTALETKSSPDPAPILSAPLPAPAPAFEPMMGFSFDEPVVAPDAPPLAAPVVEAVEVVTLEPPVLLPPAVLAPPAVAAAPPAAALPAPEAPVVPEAIVAHVAAAESPALGAFAPPAGLHVIPGMGDHEPEVLSVGNEALEELFSQLDFGAPSPEILAGAAAKAPRTAPHLTVVSNRHPVLVNDTWSDTTELPEPEQPWKGWLSR